MTATNTAIDYIIGQLQDLRVVTTEPEVNKRARVTGVAFAGEVMTPSGRFWRSLFHRFGLNDNVFRYFSHDEVFDRVVRANPDQKLRLCIASGQTGRPTLLAVSSPRRPVLDCTATYQLLTRHQGTDVRYHDGVLSSAHVPRSGERPFEIGPDRFNNRFVVEAPIDGFGQPRVYLSLLRQICANGAVGYTRAFRSDIRVGEDALYTLDRALSQFDHDEGFAALRQRFESAQKSWASVRETLMLQRTLARLPESAGGGNETLRRLNQLAGDLHGIYGLANLESLSAKRQRVLPARCRVYDLLNFASEVATHRANADGRLRLQAYIGSMVSEEFDLEGTAEKVPQFADLFLHLN